MTPSELSLTIDGGFTPINLLETIPDLIAERLREHGVTKASIALPVPDLTLQRAIAYMPRAVVLRLNPQPLQTRRALPEIPTAWLERSLQWLGTSRQPEDLLWASAETTWFPVKLSEATSCVDAFPYQVLGPRHLQRLNNSLPSAQILPGGRAELFVGAPF